MMKKLLLGIAVSGLVQLDCCGMNRSNSDPALAVSTGIVDGKEVVRPSSAPVPIREIEDAISNWAHLVPMNAVTEQVNKTLQKTITSMGSQNCKSNMKELIEFVCNPDNRSAYANYVHMVFIDALLDCDDEEINKFGGMLAGIANSRGGTSSLFWNWYDKGYFNSTPLEAE